MERKRVEQQAVVTSLQNDQKVLQGVIAQRRQQQQALNAQIDRLIQIEIQKARARAIAEARAQAAARAAAAKKRRGGDCTQESGCRSCCSRECTSYCRG